MLLVRSLVSVCSPSSDGALRSIFVKLPTSPCSAVHGSIECVEPRPGSSRWWSRCLKFEVKMALNLSATTAVLRRVGSSDPAIGDFPAALGLAPIQGVKWSSGSGASPTAPVRRLCWDLEDEGLRFVVIGILVSCGMLLALVLCCCVYRCAKWCCCGCGCVYRSAKWCCCRVATSLAPRRPHQVEEDTTIERFVQEMANQQPIRFTPEQLAGFTGNYSVQLGRGGFGTVYRGALPNGLALAVKVLHGGLDRKTSEQQFMAEMGTIGRTRHINLVTLYGFCSDAATATHALVYEFMEHGALDAYLSARGPEGVSMATVATIATGVARGLRYLHEECKPKILHLDIKPGNVLLDHSLAPKVADFGLARLLNRADTHVSVSRASGTPGYAAPEVWLDFELRLTEKCDVYSFGILLFDIIRRGRNLEDMDAAPESESSQRWFPMMAWTRYEAGELMELVVPTAGRHGEDEARRCRDELAERMCKVAFWCAQRQPPDRPSMREVVKMLEGEMKIDPPPNPFQYLDAPASAAHLRMAMASGLNTLSAAINN